MILVDTSVWIDHLHASEPELIDLLARDEVGTHPAVIEELALGSIKARSSVISLLRALCAFPSLSHDELLEFVDSRQLWGRGLSATDAHLLGSVLLEPGSELWTRDKRLRAAAGGIGVSCLDSD
ncbi:MAG TPA: type II toxin-antitoxin system VapC family toxin [Jatrophihabitantaceae bacterium]|nr:type II toxin-antitoxin system VapC family toxin [Jatrophihabitantaceae bacterium]